VVSLLLALQAGSVGTIRDPPARYVRFFRALGHRIRSYRTELELTQEDMTCYGFSVRHWQMIEAGRPVTVFTLVRICETFEVPLEQFVAGLSHHYRRRRKEGLYTRDGRHSHPGASGETTPRLLSSE
jgi:transcriptional regulator with XRE-family HTH domain